MLEPLLEVHVIAAISAAPRLPYPRLKQAAIGIATAD